MKEVKPPQKPIIFYYLLRWWRCCCSTPSCSPSLTRGTIKEVNYSEFLQMLRDGQVQEVQVEQDVILFVDNAERPQIYEAGRMEDPELVDRLEEAKSQYGLEYGQVVVEEMSPLMSFLLTWVLPIVGMVLLGQLLTRLMLKKMGTGGVGGPAMTFGKSNAKVYVPSTTGIKFADVAGEDEAKEILTEIVDFLHNPQKYNSIGAKLPKGALLSALRARARPCWPRPSRARPTSPSSRSPARSLWRCSSAWARPRSATCSSRRRKRRPALCSSTRSIPSAKARRRLRHRRQRRARADPQPAPDRDGRL